MTRSRRCAFAAVALAVLLASCVTKPETRYARWLAAGHRTDAERYGAFLQHEGVVDVVPMPALSRTSRSWRRCRNDEFATPPPDLWPNMPPTLQVIRTLRDAGILDPAQARSVYRNEAVNACAGGSAGSKHRENRAVDFDLPPNPDNVKKLCEFWRTHGPALNMGLGFYTPTAIHVDTGGFRTWGEDHHRATSLCVTEAPL